MPNFTALALEDLWTPTDKLNINLGLRGEDYEYNLANTSNNGQNFWFFAGQHEFCYNPITLAPYFIPEPPASGRPAIPFVGFNCPIDNSIPAHPVQTVHPNGKDGHLLLSNTYTSRAGRLRVYASDSDATYTINPDTVLRFSAGRYAQEPETYQVQYNAEANNLAYDLFQAFWQYGYTTPLHDAAGAVLRQLRCFVRAAFQGHGYVDQGDAVFSLRDQSSLQHRVALRASPAASTQAWSASPVSRSSSPRETSSKNGLSFLISYTYTNAAERWNSFPGTSINPIDPYNQDIANFNGLTRPGAARSATRTTLRVTSSRTPSASSSSVATIRRSGIRTTRCRRSRFSTVTAGIPSASITPIYRRTF